MPAMRILTLMIGVALTAACGGGGGGGTTNPPPPPPPPSGMTTAAEIQGTGASSPLQGQTVTVTGQVTGDFQEGDADDRRNLGGFYLQDGPPDGNFDTSDGIFVFENETGFLPMTWNWDSTSVNPGTHYLTANLRGYEGNFGIATLKVDVEREGDSN